MVTKELPKHEVDLSKKLKRWFWAGVVIVGLVMAYNTVIDTGKANERDRAAEAEAVAAKEQQAIVDHRRETGFVEVRRTVNAFEETTAMDYLVVSKVPGVFMDIETGASGSDIKKICFSAITQDEKKYIFAPYKTISVYAKFDGGETRSFNMTRGSNESQLCVVSINRFLFNLTAAKSMQIAIPYLDHYTHTSEVAEFNLTIYNGMIK